MTKTTPYGAANSDHAQWFADPSERQRLQVTAVASGSDERYLRSRGASHFIARGEPLPPRRFHGVLDAAGLGAEALAAVADGGTYVGLWPGSEPAGERDIRVGVFVTTVSELPEESISWCIAAASTA